MDYIIEGINKIKKSKLFDERYYLKKYGDQLEDNTDLLNHFLNKGYKEGKNPSPTFDTLYYLNRYLDVKNSNINPLIHYAIYGKKEHRFTNLKMELDYLEIGIKSILQQNLFDECYYFDNYGESINGMDCLTHYISFGYKEGKNPSVNFDNDFYLLHYSDVQMQNPLIHYALYGRKKGYFNKENQFYPKNDFDEVIKIIKENNLFDCEYYLNKNNDVKKSGICPVTHYIKYGFKEDRKISTKYNFNKYIKKNKLGSDINPLVHFALNYDNSDDLKELEYPKIDYSISELKNNRDKKYLFNKQFAYTYIYFASSKAQLKNEFKFVSRDSNSIILSKNSSILSLKELASNSKEYLNTIGNKNIIEENFYVGDCPISRTIENNNGYILNYWFSKNDKDYNYNLTLKLQSIENLIIESISNSLKQNIPSEDNYFNVVLKKLSVKNIESALNDYLDENNGADIIKEKISMGEEYIYRTHLKNKICNSYIYWFSKDDVCYNYEILLNINEIQQEICRIIDTTFPIFDNVKEHLIDNYLMSIDDFEFNENVSTICDKFKNKISIIIPIYNAYEDTKSCIESVFKNTILDFNLFLIDDMSTDKRISLLLNQYEKYGNVFIIKNSINKGFTKNVNMGMRLSNTDVVLLNSDTIVTKNWDRKLILAAYSNKNIATVTPMANASDISVPILGQDNEIPKFLDINKMGKLIEHVSFKGNITSPTGNGFCLFIKREALNDLDLFDENSFDKGYGEETDFTMRARKNGWINVRNDSIFIFHNRSSSFTSSNANKLRNEHKNIIDGRYPSLTDDWDKFVKSLDLINSNYLVNYALNNYEEEFIKTNILYITDIEDGSPNIDNIDCIMDKFNVFILTLKSNSIKLWYYDLNFKLIDEIIFDNEIPNIGELNKFYMRIFNNLKIDLVFLRFSKYVQIPFAPEIMPIKFADKIKIPILYGRCSSDLLNQMKDTEQYPLSKIDFNNEKGVVYTALFGGYEKLLDPKVIHPNLEYICFTDDSSLKSDIWDIRIVDNLDTDNTRKARTIKVLPHKYLKEYDFSIWVDAGFQIIGDLEDYVNSYSKNGLLLGIKHSWRNSIYEEFDAVLHYQKEDESVIESLKNRYISEGFPEDVGLIESGFLFRRHNDPKIIDIMEQWYSEIMNFSKRDQLSFNYLCWKNNFVYDEVPIFYWKNQYVEHFYHFHEVVNNKTTKPQFKIILIANNDFESTKKSLNSINNISNNISIIILSLLDYSSLEGYNIKNYRVEYPEEFILSINQIANESVEDFIYILCSGDLINYSHIKKIIKLSKKPEYKEFGALILGDISYIENNVCSNFNNFISNKNINNNNGVLINRNLLNDNGGFNIESEFIQNLILKLSKDYDIVKLINNNELK